MTIWVLLILLTNYGHIYLPEVIVKDGAWHGL
jgi:hypothetical protein